MDNTPVLFSGPAQFRAWLRSHHRKSQSLVLRIAKAHAAHRGITYSQALDEALCFGWIDGVRRSIDQHSFSVRFSPRKPRSIWSRINVRHAERLIQSRKMTRAGLEAFQARDERRTGIYSFEQRAQSLDPSREKRFRANRAAWRYFQGEAPWYRRTSAHWVVSAKKEETRTRRLETLIDCSARGERIPPLRRKKEARNRK